LAALTGTSLTDRSQWHPDKPLPGLAYSPTCAACLTNGIFHRRNVHATCAHQWAFPLGQSRPNHPEACTYLRPVLATIYPPHRPSSGTGKPCRTHPHFPPSRSLSLMPPFFLVCRSRSTVCSQSCSSNHSSTEWSLEHRHIATALPPNCPFR
jgi:hypothetical protein